MKSEEPGARENIETDEKKEIACVGPHINRYVDDTKTSQKGKRRTVNSKQ